MSSPRSKPSDRFSSARDTSNFSQCAASPSPPRAPRPHEFVTLRLPLRFHAHDVPSCSSRRAEEGIHEQTNGGAGESRCCQIRQLCALLSRERADRWCVRKTPRAVFVLRMFVLRIDRRNWMSEESLPGGGQQTLMRSSDTTSLQHLEFVSSAAPLFCSVERPFSLAPTPSVEA
jgi:hypothetical protein